MTKLGLSNHTAAFTARSDRAAIRDFYCDVLGFDIAVESDAIDRFQFDDLFFIFVYQDTGLAPEHFMRATWLELKTDNLEGLTQRILASKAKVIDVPDPHLYFQAPGGQVFKLVGADEDLTVYETSTSATPGRTLELAP